MPSTNSIGVLRDELLLAAFRAVAAQEGFGKKLEWWLISPHAAERWLQFELAYQLNQVYLGEHLVACEISVCGSRADLAIFNAVEGRSPLWKCPPEALIELKMPGNWYLQKEQINGFHYDMSKVDGYALPSLALACCVEVCGKPKGDLYDWCFDQILSAGKTSFAEMLAALREGAPGAIECLDPIDVPSKGLQGFTSMRLHPCVYRNASARGEGALGVGSIS